MLNLKYRAIFLFIIFGAVFHGYFYGLESILILIGLAAVLLITVLIEKRLSMNLFQWLLLLFAVNYWIAVFYAQDHELAMEEALKVSSMVLIGIIAGGLNREYKIKILKLCIWVGSGLVVLGILFNLYRQNRLESTIEYANALAIFLLITAILCIINYMKERRIYQVILLAIQLAGLLLTLSRSVWILWIAAIIVLLISFKPLRTKELIVKLGIAHLLALALAILVKWDVFFFLNRVQTIQAKASELQVRFEYWKDSLAMIRDHWLLGTGGGGWSVLLPEYSSPVYYVKYAHNHFLQVFMDTGLIGITIFIGMIIVFYRAVWSEIRMNPEHKLWLQGVAIIVLFLLMHAAFDFDLSFPWMLGILTIMMSMATKIPSTNVLAKKHLYPAVMAIIAFLLITGWLAVGYSLKAKGEHVMNVDAKMAQAEQHFAVALYFLPWSSRVHYDIAKGYVLLGNQTNNTSYYKKALKEIQQAIELSPKQSLYQSLFEELKQVNN